MQRSEIETWKLSQFWQHFFFFDSITVLAALLGDKVGKLPSLPLNASFKSKAV